MIRSFAYDPLINRLMTNSVVRESHVGALGKEHFEVMVIASCPHGGVFGRINGDVLRRGVWRTSCSELEVAKLGRLPVSSCFLTWINSAYELLIAAS